MHGGVREEEVFSTWKRVIEDRKSLALAFASSCTIDST